MLSFTGWNWRSFEDCHALFAVDFEFYSEDFGSIDEFAHSFVGYNEVGSDEALAVTDFYNLFTGL